MFREGKGHDQNSLMRRFNISVVYRMKKGKGWEIRRLKSIKIQL